MSRVDYFNDASAPQAQGRVPGVVMAVLDAEGRLLLARRVDNDLWVLPGGKIELGETVSEAAVREVLEETGIEAAVTGFAAIYTDPGHVIAYDDGTVLQEFSITLRGRALNGSQPLRTQAGETSEVGWFTTADLENLTLHPVMRQRITEAMQDTPTVK